MRFADRKVLVTGGARGIGAATALAFRDEGARIAIGARSIASYDAFIARHGADGFLPAIGRIGRRSNSTSMVLAAIGDLGGLDILVNSAGIFAERPIEAVDQEHWDETMEVNLAGTFFCIQAALPALSKAEDGVVINVVSDAGLMGYSKSPVYSAAKGGVANLTQALAIELARRVRVNGVCPGNVDTDMIQEAARASGDPAAYLKAADDYSPLKRMAKPAEVAAAILYLASPIAAAINGALLPIDGGGVCGV
ncbi:MAG TPA: SDR family NAD(P)-dependent oxidoreductase [Dongiaceae bacterium]